jgi:CotH kinase protein
MIRSLVADGASTARALRLHLRRSTLAILLPALWACGGDPSAPAEEPPLTPNTPSRPVAQALPTLWLFSTDGIAITSKETYLPGTFRIVAADGKTVLQEGGTEVRGRGNSTWAMPKKPYRLKLASSTALMGMPANRHWVLLANYADKTLMRNDVTFELSRMLGMEYTPRSQSVELQLNGQYQGVYQLVEHIRIAPERVNIPELKVADTSATAVTGGYLMEVDERSGEDFCFKSSRTPMNFCFANPETLRDPAWSKQRAYITNYLQQTDAAIFGAQFADPATGYAAYLDVDSAIRYYLINELFKNVDGNLRLSTYLYKKRSGKLFFGPVWDFDLAIGNVNYDNADRTDGWHIRTAPWFTRLFQDPAFAAKVKARWLQMKRDKEIDRLYEFMLTRRDFLSKVQEQNFARWPILSTWVWPNRVVTGSYGGEVVAMGDWLFERIRWMDTQFGT